MCLLGIIRPNNQRNRFRRLLSAYPTAAERLARLEEIVGDSRECSDAPRDDDGGRAMAQATRIRLMDYVKGTCFLLLPAMLPLTIFAYTLLNVVATYVLRLQSEGVR